MKFCENTFFGSKGVKGNTHTFAIHRQAHGHGDTADLSLTEKPLVGWVLNEIQSTLMFRGKVVLNECQVSKLYH
jgi:hypothetical protein